MRDKYLKLIEEMPESALEEVLEELEMLDEHYRYVDECRLNPVHKEPVIVEAIVLNKETV